jgi:hypothetical protein
MITDSRLEWLSNKDYVKSESGQIAGELQAARRALRRIRDFEPVTNGEYAVMEAIPTLRKIAIAALAPETPVKHEPTAMGFRCKCGQAWPCHESEGTDR